MNEAKLTPVERARLWHWRLGHPADDAPVRMSKSQHREQMDVSHVLSHSMQWHRREVADCTADANR